MKKTDSYNHILRYTGLFGGVQGLNILVGVVRNKLVAMILGPDGMGLISLFNSTLKLMSDSTNFWNIYQCCQEYIRTLRQKRRGEVGRYREIGAFVEFVGRIVGNVSLHRIESVVKQVHFFVGRTPPAFHFSFAHCSLNGFVGRRACYIKRTSWVKEISSNLYL